MTLQEAVLINDIVAVRRILVENPVCIDEKPDGLWLPYLAARLGHLDIVKYMVEYSRASFNETDENCRTMLHFAVESGNLELVKYLTERVGLSPVAGDINLVTPYELAAELEQQAGTVTEEKNTRREVGRGICGAEKAGRYAKIVEYFESYCGFSLENSYKNPILTGMHPDPSIVRVGEDYYMVNSSFVFFPCIPISHSKDLIHWEVIGHAITNPAWSGLGSLEGGRGYWAPDISYYEGKFYITATYRKNDVIPEGEKDTYLHKPNTTPYRLQMVVSAERPEGPYCEPVFIEEDGIDPSIFTDDDGRRYMLLNRGARIFEISPDGKQQLSEAKLLYYGHNKRAPEGSHLLKKDGWYYLFQAEGGTGMGHRISVARSRGFSFLQKKKDGTESVVSSLFDANGEPCIFEPCPFNPIMRQNDEKQAIQRCGHGKPVQTTSGEWYMVYLCGRQLHGKWSMLGRETALDKITWTLDGWPMVNQLQGPSVLAERPGALEKKAASEKKKTAGVGQITPGMEQRNEIRQISWHDPSWVTVREPQENFAEIREDGVHLLGSSTDLCEVSARNLLLQRQTKFTFTTETRLDISTLKEDQDAGMTCYYDENTYLKFGVFIKGGKAFLKVQEHVDNDTWDSACVEIGVEKTSDIILRCETKGLEREFFWRPAEEGGKQSALSGSCLSIQAQETASFHHLLTLPNVYYLCDEGIKRGKRFTGAMIGVYVHGEETRVLFRYFRM